MRVAPLPLLVLALLHVGLGALSVTDVSLNTSECFVAGCNGVFTVSPSLNVTVGGYINVLNTVRTTESCASLSGILWLTWPVCSAYESERGLSVFRPSLTTVFYNLDTSDNWYLTPVYAAPICSVRPGFAYQRWSFVGNFKQYYDFRSFPLDHHVITVAWVDSSLNAYSLQYVAEDVNTSDLAGLAATGWEVIGRAQVVDTVLIPSQKDPTVLVPFSRFQLQVHLSRGALVFGFRMLPPIIITVFCSLLILVMGLRDIITRIGTSIGGLLTIVFLQFSFTWAVPSNLSYLTRLDWLLLTCYFILLLVVCECFVMYFLFRFRESQLHHVKKKRKERLPATSDETARSSPSTTHLSCEWSANKALVDDLALQQKVLERSLVRLRYIDVAVLLFLSLISLVALIVVAAIPGQALED